jgi:hypothetical protein
MKLAKFTQIVHQDYIAKSTGSTREVSISHNKSQKITTIRMALKVRLQVISGHMLVLASPLFQSIIHVMTIMSVEQLIVGALLLPYQHFVGTINHLMSPLIIKCVFPTILRLTILHLDGFLIMVPIPLSRISFKMEDSVQVE